MTTTTLETTTFLRAIIAGKSSDEALTRSAQARRAADKRNAQRREARRAKRLGTDSDFDLAALLWGEE